MLCDTEGCARCSLLLRRSTDRSQDFLSSSYNSLKACIIEKARWEQLYENHIPGDQNTGEEDMYQLMRDCVFSLGRGSSY